MRNNKLGHLCVSIILAAATGCTNNAPTQTGTTTSNTSTQNQTVAVTPGTAVTGEPGSTTVSVTSTPGLAGDVSADDKAFMTEAASGGIAEVEMGNAAVKQAQNAEVKSFGQHMIEDHSKANAELKQLASQKNVQLPSEPAPAHKETMNNLAALKGSEFDKQYVAEMVKDHKKDVASFEKASQSAADPDVKAFAEKTLPTLRMHLDMVTKLADQMGVKAE